MIRLERPAEPEGFLSVISAALASATSFYSDPATRRRGRAFDFARMQRDAAKLMRPTILAAFKGKCAYCESRSGADQGELDCFRPRSGVAEASGDYLGDHYWREAFNWENWLLVCSICTRNKANRFPVLGQRASADAFGAALANEQPQLLNPFLDDPDQHLVFTSDGKISGATERGRVTIEILNLNRLQLVIARRDAATEFLSADVAGRRGLLELSQAFIALKRQLERALHDPTRVAQTQAAQQEQQTYDEARELVNVESGEGLDIYRARERYVERIILENIASIERMDLDMSAPKVHETSCFALLGNNGVGKSTVLKSIALALGGKSYARRLRITSSKLLRDGTTRGRISVQISGYAEPIEINLVRGRALLFNVAEAKALVVAYGATRLLAKPGHRAKEGMAHAKIDNLFDPFLPLSDAAKWLTELSAERLEDAKVTLEALLPEDEAVQLTSADDDVTPMSLRIRTDAPRKFAELSDGYQSLLGLAVDLMDVMHSRGYQSMKSAQGIALIDELENHFHPRWRMRIVGALRRAFPRVQFIFSTHDPLCMRGLGAGEVVVLRRSRNRDVFVLTDLPDVAGLRVDQLLTSEHFGLDSTLDPESEDRIRRYQKLIAQDRLTAEEEGELEGLVVQLTEVRLLGSTSRERKLYRLIDEDEASHPMPTEPSVSVEELSETTMTRLRALVQELGADGGVGVTP